MTKGSKNSGSSASKSVASVGYISTVPVKTTVTFKGGKGGGEGSYVNKSRISYADKQTGCYGRLTTKEKASAGGFQWKNGTSGTKCEYKKSLTVRIGDKSGYTEVYNEQRVRNVSYNKSNGSKNLIGYDNSDGGDYGGYGYGYGLNTCSMIYMIPLGLSCATGVRVSNELGAGHARAARLAIRVSIFAVLTEGVLGATILILGRKLWGYCYSNEEEVVNYIAQMMLLLAGSHVVDGIQSVFSGAVRGSGRQKVGAIVNLGAYYLIGIPLAILFAFVLHMGGKGLWFGIIAALIAQALFLYILTLCTNWEKEAKKANQRVYESMIQDEVS